MTSTAPAPADRPDGPDHPSLLQRLHAARLVLALALAVVVLGGLGGAALAAAGSSADGGDRFGPGAGHHGAPPGFGTGQPAVLPSRPGDR